MTIGKRSGGALGVARSGARRRRATRADVNCELLEDRNLLSTDVTATPLGQITAQTNLTVIPAVSSGPTGLTPQQIRTAYQVNLISFSGGTVTGDGAGQTIAIVDAYDDPNIAADLAAFDQAFGLPAPPSFTVDNLGATTTDAGWALETSLDVEWAHAIAPAANIILVEAPSTSLSSLFGAASFAGQQPGVTVVSMSWGTSEFPGESAYNNVFTTPAGHANVTYVAASGDSAAYSGPQYPAVAPNVLAVGGTTLNLTSSGTYASETGWSGSTGGFSGLDSYFWSYQSEPAYQASTLASVGLSDGVRTTPDVSFNADPSSGVSVYDSVGYNGQSGWFDLGGTSAAAPAWAGLIAITDQGLATGGHGSLSTTQVLTDLYSLPSSGFNDITTGSNGYSATAGYDLVTGLGTPKSNLVVAGLLAQNGVSENPTTPTTTPATATTSTQPTTTTTQPTTTTTTTTSPHKTSGKHTKVVVKKTRKVAHKADQSSDTSGTTTSSDASTTLSSLSTSGASSATSAPLILGAVTGTQSIAQDGTAQASQIADNAIRGANLQQAPTTGGGEALVPVNQSLEPDQSRSSSPEIDRGTPSQAPMQTAVDPQLVSSFKEKDLMTRPTFVTYEPTLVRTSGYSVRALRIPANHEFDEALADVASTALSRRNKSEFAPESDGDNEPETSSASAFSTVMATGAIAAAGYRFVLRPPDDPRLRPRWYSRFPTV